MTKTLPSPDELRQAVATAMGIDAEAFMSGQTKFRVRCRRVLMLLLKKTGRGLKEIGAAVGAKDHTTALHNLRNATRDDKRLAEAIWEGLQQNP